ncbi:MAG: hypothetical protein LBK83_15920 [Treponema sp.]|nr:hypothetical protein [Treponema sp.]
MKVRYSAFFGMFLFFLLLCACSRTEPAISYGFIQLVYYQGETESGSSTGAAGRSIPPEERYSFFVIPDAEDGIDDIEEMYFYHDKQELRWHIGREDWIIHEYEETTWIGTRAIAMPGNETLPRGQFRAVIINRGGEKSERLFTFDAPAGNLHPFPFLEISDGSWRIDSAYQKNRFICYDIEGSFIKVQELEDRDGLVSELNLPQEVRTVALWAEDPEYSTSALTDAARVR